MNRPGKLAGLAQDRTRHGRNVGSPTGTKPDQCRRREIGMGRIDHGATHRERDLVRSGNPARNVGFHVNGDGAGLIVRFNLPPAGAN